MLSLLAPILSIALAGCASAPGTAPPHEDLHAALTRLAAKHHVCGVAIATIKNRQLEALDFASGCEPAPIPNANSIFQAASLSKPLFAYAVLKLVEQGKLELDVPVMHYLPHGYRHRFQPLEAEPSDLVTDPRLQAVTVRMLLNHTAGLPNWASGPLRFDSAPGKKWDYSGEGYVLLQRAVEAVTGEPLDRLMRAQVFAPLAMDQSDYAWHPRFATDIRHRFHAHGRRPGDADQQ